VVVTDKPKELILCWTQPLTRTLTPKSLQVIVGSLVVPPTPSTDYLSNSLLTTALNA